MNLLPAESSSSRPQHGEEAVLSVHNATAAKGDAHQLVEHVWQEVYLCTVQQRPKGMLTSWWSMCGRKSVCAQCNSGNRECSPAGSLDLTPPSRGVNLRPAVVARFTVGASPNRPAARKAVVEAIMICNTSASSPRPPEKRFLY
jgi:hypothetical protein